MKKTLFRSSATVMNLPRLGSLYESCFSFTHLLMRHMVKHQWQTKLAKWELNQNGFGTVIYELKTPTQHYSTVLFIKHVEPENRSERVIAREWDITFALVKGRQLSDAFINDLRQNVPTQEYGRYSEDILVLSRANKSVRMFDHIVERLASGQQPDLDLIRQVGYIVRTTAVYGNGKFGISDFEALDDDFDQSYRAQMYAVYVVRYFSLQWVEWIAKQRSSQAVTIHPELSVCLGIGNSTGLGMAPYLMRHPQVIDHWMSQKEQALTEIARLAPSPKQYKALETLLQRAIRYVQQTVTIDERQKALYEQAALELRQWLDQSPSQSAYPSWGEWIKANETLSLDAQEIFISALLEIHPDISHPYAAQMNVVERLTLDPSLCVESLIKRIEQHYAWALSIDFNHTDNMHWLWYQSENKQEPRLGIRQALTDVKPNQELPMNVAQRVTQLYSALKQSPLTQSIGSFLLNHPQWSDLAHRVSSMHHCLLGEIQTNALAKDTLPLDLLRAKLSFYGASKFDPRSDRWLRVTFYQGAPLLNKQGRLDKHNEPILFAILPDSVKTIPSPAKAKLDENI